MRWPRGQRGQALPLVLIFLTVGMLMITPVLTYIGTGLHSQRISERKLIEQETIDSGVMDAIWRIVEQGALTQITPETGPYVDDFQLGLGKWGKITIELPEVGGSEWQTIRQKNQCKIEVFPDWLEAEPTGNETFYYIIRLSMVQWTLMNEFSFTLPLGLTYSNVSAVIAGPESQSRIDRNAEIDHVNSEYERLGSPGWPMVSGRFVEVDQMPDPPVEGTWYLLKEWENGQQRLTWKPDFGARGNDSFFLVFQATGTLGWGLHSISPVFSAGVELIPLGPTASIASAMYNIIIDAGDQTIQAVIGFTETGEVVLISYQVIG